MAAVTDGLGHDRTHGGKRGGKREGAAVRVQDSIIYTFGGVGGIGTTSLCHKSLKPNVSQIATAVASRTTAEPQIRLREYDRTKVVLGHGVHEQ